MSAILELLLKTSVICGVAAATVILLRHSSAATRYAVWSAAILASLVLPFAQRVVPPVNLPVSHDSDRLWAILSDPPAVTPAITIEPSLLPIRTVSSLRPASIPISWPITIWIVGTIAVIARFACGVIGLWRIYKCSRPLYDTAWDQALADLRSQLGVTAPVSLRLGPSGIPPMTWGILRHTILLPQDAREWTPDRFRVVLAHELAHIKRNDVVMEFLARSVCSAYWFNPLIWYGTHRMNVEREFACDDQVIGARIDSSAYASHLIAIARSTIGAPRLGAASMAVPSQFARRIKRLLDNKVNRNDVSLLRGALVGLIAIVFVTVTGSAHLTAFPSSAISSRMFGLAQIDQPSFEAASVQRHDLDTSSAISLGCRGVDTTGTKDTIGASLPSVGRCVIRNVPLKGVIGFAYDIPWSSVGTRITGGPAWLAIDVYDIQARALGSSTETGLKQMLKTLLADQFHLKVHEDAMTLVIDHVEPLATAPLSFEVASVKPVQGIVSGHNISLNLNHGRIHIEAATLRSLIMLAYGVYEYARVQGGPVWCDEDRFDILAKAEDDRSTEEQVMAMLRSLLKERFKLVVNRAPQEMSIYAIVVNKSGAELELGNPGERFSQSQTAGTITFRNAPIEALAIFMSTVGSKVVRDMTGLAGTYDFSLDLSKVAVLPNADRPGPEDRFYRVAAALESQTGLKVESRKAPIDVLSIEHAERPSQNGQ